MDKRYAWKRVPPKIGEASTKRMYSDGKNKTYYWCPHQWTIDTAVECKRLKPTRVRRIIRPRTQLGDNTSKTRSKLLSKPRQPMKHA
jgi:hypothetical protein